MEINHAEYTIAEIVDRFDKDIKVNRDYQRGGADFGRIPQKSIS